MLAWRAPCIFHDPKKWRVQEAAGDQLSNEN